jgi:hypothetical protein
MSSFNLSGGMSSQDGAIGPLGVAIFKVNIPPKIVFSVVL